MRGFAAIGLHRPKYDGNIGAVIRAAGAFDARVVVLAGDRSAARGRIERTDPQTTHRHLPVIWTDDVFASMPHESIPVAVEFKRDATPLPSFVHPDSAYYIFGAEDETLDAEILSRCHHVVMVPSRRCLNLSATVNVVLYDRLSKSGGAP